MAKKSKKNAVEPMVNNILQNLKNAGEILRAAQNKKEVLEFTIRILQKLGFDRIRIWLVDEEKQLIRGAKSSYISDEKFQKTNISLQIREKSPFFIRALKTKKPYYNEDNSLLRKELNDKTVRETVGLPLMAGKKLLGEIGVDNAISKRRLDLKKIETSVTPFINNIALTLNRVIADEKIKEVNHNLKITKSVFGAAHTKEDVLKLTIRIFKKFGFDRVRIWVLDMEENTTRGAKCSYMPDKQFQKAVVSLSNQNDKDLPTNYIETIKKQEPFINDTFPILKNFFGEKKLKYSIEFPIFARKNPLGLISVDNAETNRPLNREKMKAFMPIVNHIALILERTILSEKLTKQNKELEEKNAELKLLANYDKLSGLPNRRYLEHYIEKEFTKASTNRTFTMAMLDIDFLKQINDTYGHEKGDRIIVKISEILKSDKRIDFAGRFAGDEFMFFLFRKSQTERKRILKNVLRKIKTTTQQTVSIGVITCPDRDIKSTDDLFRIADSALYQAKHTGRDRFVCAGGDNEKITTIEQRQRDLQEIEKRGTFAIDYIHQLRAVNDISDHLRLSKNEAQALRKTAATLKNELGFKRVYIYTQKTDSGELFLTASSESEIPTRIQTFTFREGGLIEKAIESKSVIDTRNIKLAPNFTKAFGSKTNLFIPLIGRTHSIGVIIVVYDPDHCFHKNDYRFFLTLGDQIESSVVKIRATKDIRNFNYQLKKEITIATSQLKQRSYNLEQQIADNKKLHEKEFRIHFELISALVTSLEEKDVYTRGHSARVASYAVKLGQQIGMNDEQLTNLRYMGLLHDVGKVAIDQSILHKRTALTEKESRELEKHPVVGHKIISEVRFLKSAANVIRHHHERWDGNGYPDGKKHKSIPLESRILAIVDSYDAMVTRRSYGYKMTRTEAIRELKLGSGKQFDPKLTKLFIKILKQGKIRTPKSNPSKNK